MSDRHSFEPCPSGGVSCVFGRGNPLIQVADIKNEAWLKSLCRSYTEANVRTLAGWANGKDVNDDLKFRAIQALMDRGWGKPSQSITGEGGEGPLVVEIINRARDPK